MDTPTFEELIANRLSLPEICEYIGADSLRYLSLEGLYAFLDGDNPGFCDACFSGDYPVSVNRGQEHRQMRLFNATETSGLRVVGGKGGG